MAITLRGFMFFKKSQALVEMGVFAGVTLMVLGILVTYVAKMNSDQYTLMESFRYALKKAHDENRIVAYGTWDDRRQTSVKEPIVGEKIQSSGAGYVHWAIPSVENKGKNPEKKLYVRINEIEYEIEPEKGGVIAPEYYTVTFNNIETTTDDSGNIKSRRTAGATEEMVYEVGGKEEGKTFKQKRAYRRDRPW